MIVDEIIRLLDHIKGGEVAKHGIPARFLAALFGSLVLHLAMWTYSQVSSEINLTVLGSAIFGQVAIIVFPLYSAAFGFIVAVGVTRGSLVRHFAYGALLPAFAYGLAGALLGPVTPEG